MIIGTGLIAKTFFEFEDDTEVLIFASGVSNSTEKDALLFMREYNLVKSNLESNPNLKFVYFSTTSIEDLSISGRQYIKHKLNLEEYIKHNSKNYLILRVSNVAGPIGNPNTIMNYLVNAVKNNVKIDIWKKAERNIIDKDDLLFILKELLKRGVTNKTVNIATRKNLSVLDILSQIELFLEKKARFNVINKGNKLDINISSIENELKIIEKDKGVGINYIFCLLKKYY